MRVKGWLMTLVMLMLVWGCGGSESANDVQNALQDAVSDGQGAADTVTDAKAGAQDAATDVQGAQDAGTDVQGAQDAATDVQGAQDAATDVQGAQDGVTDLQGEQDGVTDVQGTQDAGTDVQGEQDAVADLQGEQDAVTDTKTDAQGAQCVDEDDDGYMAESDACPEGGDCNDDDFSINPGQEGDTVGDGVDQNCDDIDGIDADGDGQASVESGGEDCNDTDSDTLAACDGKVCGDDGCGGSCGICAGSEVCQDYQCVSATWTDPTSGLTWQNPPYDGWLNWASAVEYCNDLELDGGGWHLPTISELRTLIRGCPATETGGICNIEDDGCLNPLCWDVSCGPGCLDGGGPAGGCYWPDEMKGTCHLYLSSSLVSDVDDKAWVVNFTAGSVPVLMSLVFENYFRCVR